MILMNAVRILASTEASALTSSMTTDATAQAGSQDKTATSLRMIADETILAGMEDHVGPHSDPTSVTAPLALLAGIARSTSTTVTTNRARMDSALTELTLSDVNAILVGPEIFVTTPSMIAGAGPA